MTDDLEYAGYRQWKQWDDAQFFQCGARNRAYFDREFSNYAFGGLRVLEVGFGNGELLAWLSERGAILYGAETSEALVEAAKRHGVRIIDPATEAERFDFIILMDVFEHMSVADLRAALAWYRDHLARSGRLLARFPNGQSPFSPAYQFGDITHKTQLSAGSLAQLAAEARLRLTLSRRPAPAYHGGVARRLSGSLRYALQGVVETAVQKLYAFDCVVSPNVFVELVHEP